MSDTNSRVVRPISGPGLVVNYLIDGSLHQGIMFNYAQVEGEVDDPLAIAMDTEDQAPEIESVGLRFERVDQIQKEHQQLHNMTFQNCAALNNQGLLLSTKIDVQNNQLKASLEKQMGDGFKHVHAKIRTVDRKVESHIKMQGIAIQKAQRRQQEFETRIEKKLRLQQRDVASLAGCRNRIVRVECPNCGNQVGKTYLARHLKTNLCANNGIRVVTVT